MGLPTICIFQTTYFSIRNPQGGAEVIAAAIAKSLCKKYHVYILVPNDETDCIETSSIDYVTIIHGYTLTDQILQKGVIMPEFSLEAEAIINRCSVFLSIERVVSNNLNCKQITVLGGVGYTHCVDIMNNPLYDHIIVPSNFVANTCLSFGVPASKITVINNGIDTSLFCESQIAVPLSATPYFLIAARADIHKGYYEGIDLISQINTSCKKNYKLALCIPRTTKLAEQLIEYSFHKNVEICFLGWIPHQKMPQVYSSAFCTLSIGNIPEGFGLSVIESIACGTPVVARRHGFVAELSNAFKGLIFIDDYDIESQHSCRQLLSNISTSDYLENAREYITSRFDVVQMGRQYLAVINCVIEGDEVNDV